MKILQKKNLHQAFEWNEDILCPKINYEITCPKCASVLHFQRNDFETTCLAFFNGTNFVNPKKPTSVIPKEIINISFPKYPDTLGRYNYLFEMTLHCPVCGHLCLRRVTDYYLFEEQYKVMTHVDMLNFFKPIFERDIEHYRKFTQKELNAIKRKERKEERKFRRTHKYWDDTD